MPQMKYFDEASQTWKPLAPTQTEFDDFKTETIRVSAETAKKSEVSGTNKRIDELIIGSGNANAEVSDSHVSVTKNKSFTTLNKRLEELERDTEYKSIRNIALNGNFSKETTNWQTTSGNLSIATSNNTLIITAKGSSNLANGISQDTNTPIDVSHKYYTSMRVTIRDAECTGIHLTYDGSVDGVNKIVNSIPNPIKDKEYRFDAIDTPSGNALGNFKFIFNYWYTNAANATGKIAEIKDVIVIDLTSTFGVGNEPTIEEMRSTLSKYENSWFDQTRQLYSIKELVDDLHSKIPSNQTPVTASSKWANKKANFLGDSITFGTNTTKTYHQFLAEAVPLSVARNYGISGSRIADGNNAMHSRVLTMDADADLIFVFGGTNDFNSETTIGSLFTIADGVRTVGLDTTTFYGALHKLCKNLLSRYTGKQIILMTPLHREIFGSQHTEFQPNDLGLYLDQYVKAIKEIGQWYSIPVLDLYSVSGLNPNEPTNKALYFGTDGLHPNVEGHQVIASKIQAFLETI